MSDRRAERLVKPIIGVIGLLVLWSVILTLRVSVWAAQPQIDNCVTCHLSLGVENLTKPAELYKGDIHASKGFGCVACHGGDSSIMGMEAMDKKKGFVGKPTGLQIVELCGKCHSNASFMRQYNPSLRVDQVAEYFTSVHGKRLKEQKDEKVATCASCHVAHSILPPSDSRSSVHPLRVADTCGSCHANKEYMAAYKIPTDQVEKYKQSIHWNMMVNKGDLSAPTCNDCHGNHGASPPGVSSVANVCGQCHAVNADLFDKSTHSKIFLQMGTPGCATCHSNHAILATSDAMLGSGDQSVCARCHSPTSAGGMLAGKMLGAIERLKVSKERASVVLTSAEHAGMEVSQPLFELNEANTALIKARAAIHGFNEANVDKEVEPGLKVSEQAYARGLRALDELQYRRRGLAISALIILALVIGLVVKIRQMEKKQQ